MSDWNRKDWNWTQLLEDDTFLEWTSSRDEEGRIEWEARVGSHTVAKALQFLEDQRHIVERRGLNERQLSVERRRLDARLESRKYRRYWAVAASIVLLIGVAASLTFDVFSSPPEPLRLTYAGHPDSILNIQLPDGTAVSLGQRSSLVAQFSGEPDEVGPREVWLEGEAYFSVRKASGPQETFTVHAGDLTVEVLGTMFNVNTRKKTTQVVLEEGAVSVSIPPNASDTERVFLSPGERLAYDQGENSVTTERVVTQQFTSWKDGELLFDDQSLLEVGQRLEEVFGLSVVLQPAALGEEKIRMTTSSESIEEFIETLRVISRGDITAEVSNDQLLLVDHR